MKGKHNRSYWEEGRPEGLGQEGNGGEVGKRGDLVQERIVGATEGKAWHTNV